MDKVFKKDYYVRSYISYEQLEYLLNEYAKDGYRLHTLIDNADLRKYTVILEKN